MTRFNEGDQIRLQSNQIPEVVLPLEKGRVYTVTRAFDGNGGGRVEIDGVIWYAWRFEKVTSPTDHQRRIDDLLADVTMLKADNRVLREDLDRVARERDVARVDRTDELAYEKRDLQKQLADSWVVRSALRKELNAANEARTELRRQIDSERAETSMLRRDLRAAREEIDRLNRERGIVPTRAEAVAEVEGFSVDGETIAITDGDDVIVFERPMSGAGDTFIFAADIPDDGVYITRAQFAALWRQADAWSADG